MFEAEKSRETELVRRFINVDTISDVVTNLRRTGGHLSDSFSLDELADICRFIRTNDTSPEVVIEATNSYFSLLQKNRRLAYQVLMPNTPAYQRVLNLNTLDMVSEDIFLPIIATNNDRGYMPRLMSLEETLRAFLAEPTLGRPKLGIVNQKRLYLTSSVFDRVKCYSIIQRSDLLSHKEISEDTDYSSSGTNILPHAHYDRRYDQFPSDRLFTALVPDSSLQTRIKRLLTKRNRYGDIKAHFDLEWGGYGVPLLPSPITVGYETRSYPPGFFRWFVSALRQRENPHELFPQRRHEPYIIIPHIKS